MPIIVYLVDHRHDLKVVLDSKVGIGEGLGFNSLGGVHHKDSSLTGCQRPGDFIVEVNVSRGVDEVEDIVLTVVGVILHSDGSRLYGDAPLPLDIHIVQQLVLHIPQRHGIGKLQYPVGQG